MSSRASSGTKAVEYLRSAEGAAEGVVTDIRIPDRALDGWEVARIVGEIDPEVAVVYISGHGAVEWPSRGVSNSIVLEKPFAIAQLDFTTSQRSFSRRLFVKRRRRRNQL